MNWHVFAMVIAVFGGILGGFMFIAFLIAVFGYIAERYDEGWAGLATFCVTAFVAAIAIGLIA
jgi:hypothetical protein